MNLQILVISLQRSPERREKVTQELSKTNLNWSFIDAVDGKLLTSEPKEYDPEKVKRLLGFELTRNELGCYLSHMKAWRECINKNQPTLIFEDDFILLPHFMRSLDLLLNQYQNWSLVRLQALAEIDHTLIGQFDDLSIVQNHGDPLGATAYVIKPNTARVLLEQSKSIYEPLDHFLEHQKKHGVQILALNPYPVDISRAESTIADRPERKPVMGLAKRKRSIHRMIDRIFSKNPWF